MSETLDLSELAITAAKDEYNDYLVYEKLAKQAKKKNSESLVRLSQSEFKHYEFWKKYCPNKEIKADNFKINLILFLKLLLGMTFAVKFLEKHENDVIKKYKSVAHLISEPDKAAFEEMLHDEEEHENTFASEVQGSFVRYISFIILGLADAIVEISGIHAGSLGIYKSTELTGLAGIVAGASASIAMASAAYAQAKQGFQGRASVSAVFTGVSYFINAIVLASPYFLTHVQLIAFFTSISLAVLIIAFTSYYNSIISGSRFIRDFGELAGIMLGASAALYLFGLALGSFFGIAL